MADWREREREREQKARQEVPSAVQPFSALLLSNNEGSKATLLHPH